MAHMIQTRVLLVESSTLATAPLGILSNINHISSLSHYNIISFQVIIVRICSEYFF